MKAVIFLASYFLVLPTFLIFSIVYYMYLSKGESTVAQRAPNVSYAALPTHASLMDYRIEENDNRVDALKTFFSKYKSELGPFADDVVKTADKYGVDYRLIPAIAMQESNLCKKAPEDTFNCWGWGIYGKNKVAFKSYNHGIEAVSRTLAEYKEQGLVEPDEIVKKYTPANTNNWSKSVSYFMEEIHSLAL
jgi:hypothetical protein